MDAPSYNGPYPHIIDDGHLSYKWHERIRGRAPDRGDDGFGQRRSSADTAASTVAFRALGAALNALVSQYRCFDRGGGGTSTEYSGASNRLLAHAFGQPNGAPWPSVGLDRQRGQDASSASLWLRADRGVNRSHGSAKYRPSVDRRWVVSGWRTEMQTKGGGTLPRGLPL